MNGSAERVVTPRVVDNIPDNKATSDMEDGDNPDSPLRLPSATPPSHQPVPLNRHLQRTRPGQAFPRKRTDRKAWWQDLDDASFLLLPSDRQDATSPEQSRPQEQQEHDPLLRSPKTLPSVFVLTEQPHSTRLSEDIKAPLDLEETASLSMETLPQIETAAPVSSSVQQQHTPNPCAATRRQPRAGTGSPRNNVSLSRSESAPATLTFQNDSPWSKQKRSRGVAAALDNPLEFHIGRDKGADFLQKQRDRVYQEKGASRIRHARTPAAQAHVMEARVCRALGKRPLVLQTVLSPLTRPDPHTVEHAEVMLAKAAQLREFTPQGFITEPPVRGQILAKHPIRMLPTSPITPAAALNSSTKPESTLSCEPVAPW